MIVKVRELDNFMDRTSNRSCFSETLMELTIEELIRKIYIFFNHFVNFFKIVLHLPLHTTGSFPNASSICHHCISDGLHRFFSNIFEVYSTFWWHINITLEHNFFTLVFQLLFNFDQIITRRNQVIVFNHISLCNSH